MNLPMVIAMMKAKGLKESDDIQCINAFFDGVPDTEYVCDVYPIDSADARIGRPKTVMFKRKRRDML